MSELAVWASTEPGDAITLTEGGTWSSWESTFARSMFGASRAVGTHVTVRHAAATDADYVVLVDDDLDGGLAAGDPGNAAAAPNLALRIDFGHASGVASRLEATALEVYFRIEQDSLRDRVFDLVVAAAPTVPQIISIALGIPGVDAQERAMGLLSRSIGGTLLFGRWLETILDALEPLYARKAVNIVLGGLGFVEAGHPAIDRCAAYIEHFLHDADPVNRQSAYDAMESLLATRGDAPSLNA